MESDLLDALPPAKVDAVVSNPPYIGRNEEEALSLEIREFEPQPALFAPGSADSVIRRLVTELEVLEPGTHLIFEIGHDQARSVKGSLAGSEFELVNMIDDYQGIPRVAVTRRG